MYSLQLKCYSLLSSTAKMQTKKDKDLSWSLHSSGSVPWWSSHAHCWFIEFSLLTSNQENPPNWYSKRMRLYPEASPKKEKKKIKKKRWRLGSIIYHSVVVLFPSIDEQTETQRHWIVCPRGLCCGQRAIRHVQMCLKKKPMSFSPSRLGFT